MNLSVFGCNHREKTYGLSLTAAASLLHIGAMCESRPLLQQHICRDGESHQALCRTGSGRLKAPYWHSGRALPKAAPLVCCSLVAVQLAPIVWSGIPAGGPCPNIIWKFPPGKKQDYIMLGCLHCLVADPGRAMMLVKQSMLCISRHSRPRNQTG